jgi:hypothetical protein
VPRLPERRVNVIDTTRRYPRSLREAFPIDDRQSAIGINGPVVIRTRMPLWLRAVRAIKSIAWRG